MPKPDAPRYVIADSWDHLFLKDTVPSETRFVFDREENRLASLQVRREDGWEAASEADLGDVEDSVMGANADCLDAPGTYDLAESDELPEWAQSASAPRP